MPVYETFSERKRRMERGGKPVVYRQDQLPERFRVQVAHIWSGLSTIAYNRDYVWPRVHDVLARDLGVWFIWDKTEPPRERCINFLLHDQNVDNVLSIIEIAFLVIEDCPFPISAQDSLDGAIEEINYRFQQNGLGYQYRQRQLMSVDSQYLHAEAVEPAISLLHDAQFHGPLQEFMQAHEHYRKGNNKDAIVNAQNAFESTMKAICDQRGWDYGTERATASKIIDVLFKNNLIPSEMQSHFTALRSTLESGLPTVRNQPGQGGHGQGSDVVEVPDYLAAYCLHLAATNIVLLIEAHNASK